MECKEECNLESIFGAIKDEWQRYRLLKDAYEQFVSFYYNEIKVAIVGNSPYPQSPIGIAFCRNSWEELSKENCSGHNLLHALLGMDVAQLRSKFPSPISFFFWLASKGVVFLNRYQEDDFTRKVVSDNSGKVILCGEKAHSLGLKEKYKFPHPSNQAKAQNEEKWNAVWEDAETLRRKLDDLDHSFASAIKKALDDIVTELNVSNASQGGAER